LFSTKSANYFQVSYTATTPALTQWEEVVEEPSNVNFLDREKFCIIKTF
jgi:hypothetical protein